MGRSVVLLVERPRWRSPKSVREVGANNFYMRQRPETKGLSRRKVGFGSLADITPFNSDVRSTPESEHSSARAACPLSANSGHHGCLAAGTGWIANRSL